MGGAEALAAVGRLLPSRLLKCSHLKHKYFGRCAHATHKPSTIPLGPRSYTPAVFRPIFREASEFTDATPITACNDILLTAAQQAACAKCIGIKRCDACLATVSDTYWGVDQSSCTW